MTDKERIAQLEARLANAEARIAQIEASQKAANPKTYYSQQTGYPPGYFGQASGYFEAPESVYHKQLKGNQ